MGMSASQVRFLTLQDRKSTIGMQLGVLSNRKMALSRDMTNAAREYNEAFAATTLQWYDSINGEYTDITYSSLMMPNAGNAYTPYLLSDRVTGNVILDSTVGGVGEDVINLLNNLTGNSPTNPYKPGTVEFNDNMKLDIIEDIMQVPNFDRNKFAYHPIENTTIFEGGVQRFTQSEIIDSLGNVGIGELYLNSKVAENISTNGGRGYNSETSDGDSYENNGQKTTGVFTSDGSQITVNENTWWSTLYNNNAVVCVGSCYRYDSSDTYSPGNGWDFIEENGWAFGYADSWVSAFVDAVINSEPVKNSGINYNRNAIINAAKTAIRTFNGGNQSYNYADVGDQNAANTHANVDLRIYNESYLLGVSVPASPNELEVNIKWDKYDVYFREYSILNIFDPYIHVPAWMSIVLNKRVK